MGKYGTLSANLMRDDAEMLDAICKELNISVAPEMREEIHEHIWQKCGYDSRQHDEAKNDSYEYWVKFINAARRKISTPELSRITLFFNKKSNREASERWLVNALYCELEIYRTLLRMQLSAPLDLQQAPWQTESYKTLIVGFKENKEK